MRFLSFVAGYFRQERATAWMLVFLAGAIAVSALTHVHLESFDKAPVSSGGSAGEADTERDVVAETKAKMELLQKNPQLMMRIGLLIALFLIAGLLIDIFYLSSAGPGLWRPNPAPDALWGPSAVFKGFVFLFFAELLISIAAGVALSFFPDAPYEPNLFLMSTTFLRNVATAVYVFALVRHRYGAKARELGFTTANWAKNIRIGLIAYIGFFPVYFGILLVIMGALKLLGYEPPMQNVVEMVYREDNIKTLLAFGLFIAFVGPLFEELFFRGFMYRAFRKKWGMASAIVFTSFIFAVMHAHWVALVPIFALSALLCFLYEKTGSITAGATLHMIHNIATLGIMLGVKYFEGT